MDSEESLPDAVDESEMDISVLDEQSDLNTELPSAVIEDSDSDLMAENAFLPDDVEESVEQVVNCSRVILGTSNHNIFDVPSPAQVTSWLQQPHHDHLLRMEWYSPPRVLVHESVKHLNLPFGSLSFDIVNGWDLEKHVLQDLTFRLLDSGMISMLYLSPPCTVFSELQRLWNRKKMEESVWEARWAQGNAFLEHSMMGARKQVQKKKKFMFEHPWRASSWDQPSVESVRAMEDVYTVDFDMCAVGMLSPKGSPVRKRTRIMSNCYSLIQRLRSCQCSRDHEHRTVQGSELGHKMSTWCQIYPPGLVQILAENVSAD